MNEAKEAVRIIELHLKLWPAMPKIAVKHAIITVNEIIDSLELVDTLREQTNFYKQVKHLLEKDL
jgi:hypothetical protein